MFLPVKLILLRSMWLKRSLKRCLKGQRSHQDLLAKQSHESGGSERVKVFMRLEALSAERKGLLEERERQREELNHLRELSHRQQRRLQEKDRSMSLKSVTVARLSWFSGAFFF